MSHKVVLVSLYLLKKTLINSRIIAPILPFFSFSGTLTVFMSKQSSFLDLAYHKPCKNRTRDFLQIMDRVIPWDDLVAIVDPYVSLNKTGRKHIPIETKITLSLLAGVV